DPALSRDRIEAARLADRADDGPGRRGRGFELPRRVRAGLAHLDAELRGEAVDMADAAAHGHVPRVADAAGHVARRGGGDAETFQIGERADAGLVAAAAGIVEDHGAHPRLRGEIAGIEAAMR